MEPKQKYLDWYSAFLLVVMVYLAAARLTATGWIKNLSIVETVAVMGTVLGLALGASIFQKRAIAWWIAGYSLLIIPLQLTRLVEGEEYLDGRLLSLGGRTAATFMQLFRGEDVVDPVFFILLMSLLFWGLGIFSGFRLVRHISFLAAVIPSTIPLLVVQYYDGANLRRLWLVAFYFFVLLLLLGRITLHKNRQRWVRERVFTGIEPAFDLNYAILVGALAIVLVSWTLPVTINALPAAVRWWQDVTHPLEETRQRLDDIFASLRRGTTSAGRFSTVLGLGKNAAKGENAIFHVDTPSFTLPRMYWRVISYDKYSGGAWRTSSATAHNFSPNDEPLSLVNVSGLPTQEFSFSWMGSPEAYLATPQGAAWVSRAGPWYIIHAENDAFDLVTQNAAIPLQPGDRYTARAVVSNPAVVELRAAGENYPDWVENRFLQLPEETSPQIKALAASLTNGLDTPFDKAQAITDYLRNEIDYSDSVPAAPPGTDPVAWFLFSWKSGFCNYYATAEVLLLRSAGIPARMVVGFAQGAPASGGFTVRARDTHAWPEVYFPGYGWVPFEPTTNQIALVRPYRNTAQNPETEQREGSNRELSLPVEDNGPDVPPSQQTNAAAVANRAFPYLLVARWVIIVALSSAFSYWLWRLNLKSPLHHRIPRAIRAFYLQNRQTPPAWLERWVLWIELTPIERSFHAINQCLGWLQQSQAASVTAVERAALLSHLVPSASEEIQALAREHENTLFSPYPGNAVRATRASWKIRYFTIQHIIRSRSSGVIS